MIVTALGRTGQSAHNETVGKSSDAERDVLVEGERPPPIKSVVGWWIERTLGFIWIGIAVAGIEQLAAGHVIVGLIWLAVDLGIVALWAAAGGWWDRRAPRGAR
jgi:hypothetical protein